MTHLLVRVLGFSTGVCGGFLWYFRWPLCPEIEGQESRFFCHIHGPCQPNFLRKFRSRGICAWRPDAPNKPRFTWGHGFRHFCVFHEFGVLSPLFLIVWTMPNCRQHLPIVLRFRANHEVAKHRVFADDIQHVCVFWVPGFGRYKCTALHLHHRQGSSKWIMHALISALLVSHLAAREKDIKKLKSFQYSEVWFSNSGWTQIKRRNPYMSHEHEDQCIFWTSFSS